MKTIVNEESTIRCIRRIYEISYRNKVTRIASNKIVVGDVLDALLREDYELGKFVENFDVLGTSVVSVIPMKESVPHIAGDKKESRSLFSKMPSKKERRWMILHDMPDNKDFTQKEWVDYMAEKNYDRKQVQGVVSGDLIGLIKLGNLQRVSVGNYKIVDKEIYKDDKGFLGSMEKLKSGEKLILA